MWLDGLSARVAAEVGELLCSSQLIGRETEVWAQVHELLQYLAVQVAGRELTPEEFGEVRAGGSAALENLLRRYQQERLRRHTISEPYHPLGREAP